MAKGIATPDPGPVFPQSVAEEGSVKPANDAIRDRLLQQSGRTADEGDRRATAVEEPAPRKRSSRKADDSDK